ncbi:hypothetical protein, partial [Thalassobaculum salexigens]|uniref:hypothetical protein n=1 Tax=Thalassobaculum salexigens TaxID=455360 RepID=UPI00248E0CB0
VTDTAGASALTGADDGNMGPNANSAPIEIEAITWRRERDVLCMTAVPPPTGTVGYRPARSAPRIADDGEREHSTSEPYGSGFRSLVDFQRQ